jgi:hypothetical protein
MKDITEITDDHAYITGLLCGYNKSVKKYPYKDVIAGVKEDLYLKPPKKILVNMPRHIDSMAIEFLKDRGYNVERMPGDWLSSVEWYQKNETRD